MATYSLGCASCFYLAGKIAALGRPRLLTFIWCGMAIGIAGATRIPGLIFLGIGPLVWAFTLYMHWRENGEKGIVNRDLIHLLKGIVLSSISSLLVVVIFFPRVQFQLFSSIPNVANRLHTSASEIPLLFNGNVSDAGAGPFAYAHKFFLISTPIWMLVLFVLGCVLLGRKLYPSKSKDSRNLANLLSFTGVAAFPWVYILITQPALHNGIRHMLFGIPSLVILMGFGFTELQRYVADQSKLLRVSTTLLFSGFVLFQTVDLILMHPYQYVAFNSLAGDRANIPNRFESEYWFTSSKHLLEDIPNVVQDIGFQTKNNEPVKIRISGPLDAARAFVPPGFILVDDFNQADFYISNTTMRADLLADGQVVYQISRGGIPIGVIKKLR